MTTRRIRLRPLVSVGVVALGVIAVVLIVRLAPTSAETRTASSTPGTVSSDGIIDPATADKPALIDPAKYQFPVLFTTAQWKSRLTPDQFFILRDKGTEPPFSGKYFQNHQDGTYYSAATGQPLFSSKDKFDSGTGWPSFTKPIDSSAVVLTVDDSDFMPRIEVEDSLSGSHLGHVFDDGPPPTGKRYCMDSAALIFVPAGGTPPKMVAPNNPKAELEGSISGAPTGSAGSR
jgi:peptide-methionine (R)-S-oxide reductase